MMPTFQIPASIKAAGVVYESMLEVDAMFDRGDDENPRTVDIDAIRLPVDAKHLRARLITTIRVTVEGRSPQYVAVDPELLAKVDVLDLDDEALMDEIADYLLKEIA